MTPGLRRRIEIATRHGEARAVVEDDYHHFRVVVRHAAGVVTSVRADSPRHPFSACPLAADQLTDLVGMALDPASQAVYRRTDARHQCTHMLDLAGLAIAAASRKIGYRIYEAETPDRLEGRTAPRLWRDGVLVMAWDVEDDAIVGPEPYAGLSLGQGFAGWVRDNLAQNMAEAALVLRRAVTIAVGRTRALDELETADSWGRCFTTQPERAPSALRIKGSTRDFSGRTDQLCRDDQAWLTFKEE
jgi:hypothetical protein